jgi:hypothetical protein
MTEVGHMYNYRTRWEMHVAIGSSSKPQSWCMWSTCTECGSDVPEWGSWPREGEANNVNILSSAWR